MTNIGIPLGSLNRDEIYTFLGGLTVALAWLIWYGSLNAMALQYNALSIGMIFTLTWLITTTVTYICILIFMQVVFSVLKNILKRIDVNKSKEIIQMENVGPIAIYYENIVEQHINNHILNVITISFTLSIYPIVGILNNINISPKYPIGILVFIVFCAIYFSVRHVRALIALEYLIREGIACHISFQQHIVDMAQPFSNTKKASFTGQINEVLQKYSDADLNSSFDD